VRLYLLYSCVTHAKFFKGYDMSRLFGVRVSDASLLSCALYPFAKDLVTEVSEDNREGWGVGFYQDDRVLVKKRPQSLKTKIDFAELAADVRTQSMICHARKPTSGMLAPEDTHPFQFRTWLFAHHGMLESFDARKAAIEEKIPEFLRQHLAGDTDSERAFFLFLTALSRSTHQRLEDPTIRPEQVGDALRSSIQELKATQTKDPDTLNFIVTNGRTMVATGVNRPLYTATIQGIKDCPRCRVAPLVAGREPTAVDHPHLKAVLVATGLSHPTQWQEVPDNSMVLVDREVNSKVVSL
jgi:predicted glutamine amidotransferase